MWQKVQGMGRNQVRCPERAVSVLNFEKWVEYPLTHLIANSQTRRLLTPPRILRTLQNWHLGSQKCRALTAKTAWPLYNCHHPPCPPVSSQGHQPVGRVSKEKLLGDKCRPWRKGCLLGRSDRQA